MRTLIVWFNRNKNCYYYKFVRIKPREYKVGYINQYNHEIILIINSHEVQPVIIKNNISIRKGICDILIRFLEWLSK